MAITIDDFSKIWASTSPLTPYSFSESNYKEGWNFIGATPPARQMWDSIQKSNDEKLKYLLDNFADYLPLAGGTMAGAIVGNPLTLSADDGNDSADLVLDPSGSATWNGKEVERVNASGTNYIRYESGLQICWDTVNITPSSGGAPFAHSGSTAVTFPVAFSSAPLVLANINENAGYWNAECQNQSTTGATISIGGYNTNQKTAQYFAIGFWE